MALQIVASRPDPAIVSLPWSTPLEEWPDDILVHLPRGLSRHVVRIVRLGQRTYAIKETQAPIAFKEYRLLRDLNRLGLPHVVEGTMLTVQPPFIRCDLVIAEDLAEEIGRVLGYERLPALELPAMTEAPDQRRYQGIERIKDFLLERGYVEISTPSSVAVTLKPLRDLVNR